MAEDFRPEDYPVFLRKRILELSEIPDGWDVEFIQSPSDNNNFGYFSAIFLPQNELYGSLYQMTISFDIMDGKVHVIFNKKLTHPLIDQMTSELCFQSEKDIPTIKSPLTTILMKIKSSFKPNKFLPNNSYINLEAYSSYQKNPKEFWKTLKREGTLSI